jgi:hypothetical protein
MSFIYHVVQPLILPKTTNSIKASLFAIRYKIVYQLSTIFNQTVPQSSFHQFSSSLLFLHTHYDIL